jgi:hypothetical protein
MTHGGLGSRTAGRGPGELLGRGTGELLGRGPGEGLGRGPRLEAGGTGPEEGLGGGAAEEVLAGRAEELRLGHHHGHHGQKHQLQHRACVVWTHGRSCRLTRWRGAFIPRRRDGGRRGRMRKEHLEARLGSRTLPFLQKWRQCYHTCTFQRCLTITFQQFILDRIVIIREVQGKRSSISLLQWYGT